MNKVIVEKNKLRMDGNTVLSPDESLGKRKYEELEKSRKETESSKRQRDMKKKKSVLTNILLGFIIGMIIIARYCMIFNYQDKAANVKAEIAVLSKENDSYGVELIKFNNISYIEKIATQKLHMVKPMISDIQYVNLSKNNLVTKEGLEVKLSSDIISKLKDILF